VVNLVTVTPPVGEPISREQAKDHCRVDGGDSDTIIDSYIAAARARTETFLRRRLMEQTVSMRLPALRGPICFPVDPVSEITEIAYLDVAGDQQVLASDQYRLLAGSVPPVVRPSRDVVWPEFLCDPEAVKVTFVTGYGAATDVPADIIVAMLMMIGHFYENREEVVTGTIATELPNAARSLLLPHVFWI